MGSRRAIVESLYAAWAAGDIDGVLEHCTDDIVAVNVPTGPIEGKERVRKFLQAFGADMEDAKYEIFRMLEDGAVAMLEGRENYTKQGRRVALPYMAVFFFEGDRIREWRDYFDRDTLQRQLGGA